MLAKALEDFGIAEAEIEKIMAAQPPKARMLGGNATEVARRRAWEWQAAAWQLQILKKMLGWAEGFDAQPEEESTAARIFWCCMRRDESGVDEDGVEWSDPENGQLAILKRKADSGSPEEIRSAYEYAAGCLRGAITEHGTAEEKSDAGLRAATALSKE